MNNRYIFAKVLLCFALIIGGNSTLFSDELDTFRAAVEMLSRAPAGSEAERAARTVMANLALALETRAVADGHAWYDAGNARLWAGEEDKAIIDYRRFLAHHPFRTEAWENLEMARLATGTIRPGGEGIGAWPWTLWLLYGATALFSFAATAFGAFIWSRRPFWFKFALTVSALVLVCGASIGLDTAFRPRLAVILRETQGRKGDADVYAASPERPWPAGQEGWIKERRSGWLRLSIAGTDTWVSESEVEMIDN